MAGNAAGTVLKRMAAAGRSQGGGAPPTPARALGHAVAKVAEDLFHLAVQVTEAAEARASLADLPERITERALLALLAGPGGAPGLMALSQEVLATLIEVQTTRRIGAGAVAPRRPTRTDAAMSQRFVDLVLAELERALAADPAAGWAGGFRYGSFLDDPRPLPLLLEDTGYRVLRLTLGFGPEAARQGTLLLALPAEGRAPPPPGAVPGRAVEGAQDRNGQDWGGRLERAVLGAPVGVEAVLARVSLPLASVMDFAPGGLVPMPPGAMARVRIEGHGRRLLATGRLGQWQGNLAVRLDGAADGGGEAPGAAADAPMGRGAIAAAGAAAPDGMEELVPVASGTAGDRA